MWSSGFEIQSQQKEIIKTLWRGISKYNICSPAPKISRKGGDVDKRGITNNKDMWRFNINKKDSLKIFIDLILPYIKHENKLKTIRKIEENLKIRGV